MSVCAIEAKAIEIAVKVFNSRILWRIVWIDCKGGSIIKATEKLRPQLSLFSCRSRFVGDLVGSMAYSAF